MLRYLYTIWIQPSSIKFHRYLHVSYKHSKFVYIFLGGHSVFGYSHHKHGRARAIRKTTEQHINPCASLYVVFTVGHVTS
jgi:hypothetical protein